MYVMYAVLIVFVTHEYGTRLFDVEQKIYRRRNMDNVRGGGLRASWYVPFVVYCTYAFKSGINTVVVKQCYGVWSGNARTLVCGVR